MAVLDSFRVNGTDYDLRDSKAVRFDEQTLTNAQKLAARQNIGAADDSNSVHINDAQNLTEAQKAQARENIGAVAINQGVAQAGKAMIVGPDGVVTLGEAGVPESVAEALLSCLSHVAWTDEHGQDYYDALETALYGDAELLSISAAFNPGSNVIYDITPLDELKQYLTVTGTYSNGTTKTISIYTLTGTLAVGTSTITVTKEGKTTTFTVTVEKYWSFEWDYTDGLPDSNGFTKEEAGSSTVTLTADGLRVATEDTSDKYTRYKRGFGSAGPFSLGIYECEFRVNQYGSNPVAPYGNGVRLTAVLGGGSSSPTHYPQLTLNTSGVLYLKTGTSWTVLDSTPFATGVFHTLRVEVDATETRVLIDGQSVGTIPEADNKEKPTYMIFGAWRGTDATFRSFKYRVVE